MLRRIALLSVVLCSSLALAQAGGAKKKKVIRLDAITVEGRIQKPQAFYILQRSQLSFDELNRPESFLGKVEKSVEKEAFYVRQPIEFLECCSALLLDPAAVANPLGAVGF